MADSPKTPIGPEKKGTGPAAVISKRAPGTKEIIPLEWKLVGISSGMPVTLMRSIDRADAEAQLARLSAEGYYQDLEIHAIGDKVELPVNLVKARRREIERAMESAASAKAAKLKSSSAPAKGKVTKKKTAVSKGKSKARTSASRSKVGGKSKKLSKAGAKRSSKKSKPARKGTPASRKLKK